MKHLLLSFAFILMALNAEAGFTNSGRMQSNAINLSVGGTLENSGELIGIESITASCDTLTGKGLFNSPQITIRAKVFAFTGTIECSEKCTIVTKEAFNQKMFKRKGKGQFVFQVDPNMSADLLSPDLEYDLKDTLEVVIP